MRSMTPQRLLFSRSRMLVFLLVAALAGTAVFLTCPSDAWADNGSATSSDAQKVAIFEDVTIGPDEVWDNVIVVGGDVLVEGAVENALVVVGGDLTLGPQATVGTRGGSEDAVIVSVLGDLVVEPGGQVLGRTVDVAGSISGTMNDLFVDPVFRTWSVNSIISWVWSTVLLLLAGVIAAAAARRQVATVSDRVRGRFLSSLGWGALGAIIIVPIVTVILIATVVGIIVAIPWVVVGLPVMSLFGLAAVGAALGRLVLGSRTDDRGTLIAATVIGLLIISVLRWIPVGGAVILFLLWLAGFGATYVSIWAWLRGRRASRRMAASAHVGGGASDG